MQENRPVSRGQAVVVRVSVTLDEMLRKPCLFTLASRSSGLACETNSRGAFTTLLRLSDWANTMGKQVASISICRLSFNVVDSAKV